MPLRLYNTLTRTEEDFVPRDPARVTFYSCGPTVYDDAHIGNFRSFLAADVLRRWVESSLCELKGADGKTHKGPRKVVHVMNITDVGHMTDDAEGGESGEDRMAVAGKRIAEAKKSGKLPADVKIDPSNPFQIARFYEDRFKDDAKRLGLKLAIEAETDPTLQPRATASVDGMKELIKRLIAKGYAYVVGGAGERVVYFDVQKFPTYGRLSGNTLDQLREGAGGRVAASNQASKRHPADFLLWKEDSSHIMKWDSPWGAGYPGWHIECSVMSFQRLVGNDLSATIPNGEALIDLHSGGEDNIFPHHECEIAQSCCAFNATPDKGGYARMWFHPRFLLVEGTKMSKSKGNFFTARDLFAKGVEPAALRLELVRTHYRSNANFTMQGLADSQRQVERWRRFVESAAGDASHSQGSRDDAMLGFAQALNADLNIAAAIAEVNKFVARTEKPGTQDAELMKVFDGVLGVLELQRPVAASTDIGIFAPGVAPDPSVVAKLEERRAARAAKDFARSDKIRDELLAMGYAIKDVAGGKVEVRRTGV
ncbi:MAG: cysteine--tRNA ligase [Phycisphaerales bacterium]|jgi:cysteinyl-tRNA synthetase|nr:cysteine--tRNA ligase [Phycisphaerales bacterium]